MWKTLMVIALITAILQWILFTTTLALESTVSYSQLSHALAWSCWLYFCYTKKEEEEKDEFKE